MLDALPVVRLKDFMKSVPPFHILPDGDLEELVRTMCEMITGLHDHLTRKLISLSEEAMVREGHGRPPVPYAWLALGSEGRREQTLGTDQDNALVFADGSPAKEEEIQSLRPNLMRP